MKQLHILFNSAKTWHVIVGWFLCFSPNLPELNLKLFCSDVQNNVTFSSGKFRDKHRNQQTITCPVLAELNKIWSCLIFIKLYTLVLQKLALQKLSPSWITKILKDWLFFLLSTIRLRLKIACTACAWSVDQIIQKNHQLWDSLHALIWIASTQMEL